MNRRTLFLRFLNWVAGLPVVVGLLAAISPILRVLRPTLQPFQFNQPPDPPPGEPQVVGNISEFKEVWAYKSFYFVQRNREYSPRRVNESLIAGFAVRLPQDVAQKAGDYIAASAQSPEQKATAEAIRKTGVMLFSRICPHLGCNFNYFPPEKSEKVRADYNYSGAQSDRAYFACPCHFSTYDLKQFQDVLGQMKLGKVVNGPAPRPPRTFTFEVRDNGDIVVTGVEAGGVA